MLISAFSAYVHGILIDKFRDKKYSKVFLVSGLSINLGILVIFKYGDFIIKNISYIFSLNINLLRLTLPIGISFYTFQTLSYVVDVYTNKAKVCRRFTNFATYVCLFPQLIAGPIVRYTTIEDELQNRTHSFEKFAYGVNRFIIGLAKKAILSNNLGLLVSIISKSDEKSILSYWIVAVVFTLQIYFDFSGYSDMAIGLGRIFGFDFLENFNYPFISKSIKEFWRRWHISLSTFFRDYLYIPLGGNRVSKFRWIFNLFVVWSLTGLWHGDSWNFILWGLYFALLLIIENLFLQKLLNKLPVIIQHIYAKFFIIISFVIFNNENMKDLFNSLYNMFNFKNLILYNDFSIYYLKSYSIILIISIIASTPLLKNIIDKINESKKGEKVMSLMNVIFNVVILIVVTGYLIDGSFNPFLYFRF
ncbi:MAG: MBOAT family O-acyltransferase [Terrisporobacter sp.]|uniref:MBOAT family O-acyltransferase n=1 Tax=Terrisporobacter sp. TaxID=1965305 RepID=UPI002F92B6F8